MQTLLALIFQNESGAQKMIAHVKTLQRQQMITISDAAFVIRQRDQKIKVKQVNSLVGAGVLGGAFWGLLIGQHFWLPSLQSNEVANTEKPGIEEVDCGIDEGFLKMVSNAIQPGCSALFMIVAYMTEENLAALMSPDVMLLYTHLDKGSDDKLRAAFGIMEEM
ncbi:MAG: DUF1269 domain-containing protein [Chloroflexi bacterium]|nr:DUF1269 domain-containing protein [Chloroflexota bacterium]